MTHDQRKTGGLTVVARHLTSSRGLLVTRQGVWMWWSRRERNQFPDRINGDDRLLFDLDEVLAWYDWYMSLPWQGRRKKEQQVFTLPEPDAMVEPGTEEK